MIRTDHLATIRSALAVLPERQRMTWWLVPCARLRGACPVDIVARGGDVGLGVVAQAARAMAADRRQACEP